MSGHGTENGAPVYGCCHHCPTYDANQGYCELAPHDVPCDEPYCAGGRPFFARPIPPAKPQDTP